MWISAERVCWEEQMQQPSRGSLLDMFDKQEGDQCYWIRVGQEESGNEIREPV